MHAQTYNGNLGFGNGLENPNLKVRIEAANKDSTSLSITVKI
jgi:hypothetical protein